MQPRDDLLSFEQGGIDVQRADALGTVYLMGTDGNQIGAERCGSKAALEIALYGIGVGNDLWGTDACQGKHRFQIVQRACFVVDHHHTDHENAVVESGIQLNHVKRTAFGRYADDLKALALQLTHDVLDGGMLRVGGNDAVGRAACFGVSGAPKSQRVGFTAAGGKDQFSRCQAPYAQ